MLRNIPKRFQSQQPRLISNHSSHILDNIESKWLEYAKDNIITHSNGSRVQVYGYLEFSQKSADHFRYLLKDRKGSYENSYLATWRQNADLIQFRTFWEDFYAKCHNLNRLSNFAIENRKLMENGGVKPSIQFPVMLLGKPALSELVTWQELTRDRGFERVIPLCQHVPKRAVNPISKIGDFIDGVLSSNLMVGQLKRNNLDLTPALRSRVAVFRKRLQDLPQESEDTKVLVKWVNSLEQDLMIYSPEETQKLNNIMRLCRPFASKPTFAWRRHQIIKNLEVSMEQKKSGDFTIVCIPRVLVPDVVSYLKHNW